MPRFGSISRKDFIHYLRQLGFDGPYSGGKHQFMLKGTLILRIPNPHQGDNRQRIVGTVAAASQH